MGNIWWVGAILSFGSTAANTVGVNMQKMSAMQEAGLSPEQRKSYFRQRTWAQGMALIVCGSFGDFASLALAAQSVIAPIKSSALVVNLAVAHLYLEEVLTQWDIYGSCAIVLGSLFSVFFGSKDSRELTTSDVKELFLKIPFIVYAVLTACLLLSCFLRTKKIEKKRAHLESYFEDLYVDHSETMTMLSVLRENADYKKAQEDYTPYMKTHSFLYCALGGSFGGQSLIFVKCVAVLLRTTIAGDNQLVSPFTYLFLLTMLIFIVFQVHYLNKALIISDAMFVVPVYQCFFIFFSTTGGLIFYQEYSSWKAINWIFSSLGLFIILVGVKTLAMRDFEDLEVQFVSTSNILHNSTFELEKPLVSEIDGSDTESEDPRASISLRLGPGVVPRQTGRGGNVFTELSAVASPPLAREIVHIGKQLQRKLSNFSNTTTVSNASGGAESLNVNNDNLVPPTLNRSASSTEWRVLSGIEIPQAKSLVPSSRTANSYPPDTALETRKADEVWNQQINHFRKENALLQHSYSSADDGTSFYSESNQSEVDPGFQLRDSEELDIQDVVEDKGFEFEEYYARRYRSRLRDESFYAPVYFPDYAVYYPYVPNYPAYFYRYPQFCYQVDAGGYYLEQQPHHLMMDVEAFEYRKSKRRRKREPRSVHHRNHRRPYHPRNYSDEIIE